MDTLAPGLNSGLCIPPPSSWAGMLKAFCFSRVAQLFFYEENSITKVICKPKCTSEHLRNMSCMAQSLPAGLGSADYLAAGFLLLLAGT